MLVSTPTSEYVSFRPSARDISLSPCRSAARHTPPRFASSSLPMITPSPLRRHTLSPAEPVDADDFFQSPPKSSLHSSRGNLWMNSVPHIVHDEDDEDALFSLPSSSAGLFPPSSPEPRTPIKHSNRTFDTSDRHALSVKRLNTPASPTHTSALLTAGTKRKPTAVATTPSLKRTNTPLNVTASAGSVNCNSYSFDRLAPLSAPHFMLRTPQTKAETDLYLKRQAETMTKLRIRDAGQSGDESGYDSGHDDFRRGQRLFADVLTSASPTKRVRKNSSKAPGLEIQMRKGEINKEEVAEAISPGGHVTKRRARARPVSAELLEMAPRTPTSSDSQAKTRTASTVAFPSVTAMRTRRPSAGSSSSSETGSPRPRHRPTAGPSTRVRTQSHSSRAPMTRLASSATLFFGPAISNNKTAPTSSTTSPNGSAEDTKHPHRHSYGGATQAVSSWAWNGAQSPSPVSSPLLPCDEDEEVDLFFGPPGDSSFTFTLNEGTPSPHKSLFGVVPVVESLPKKFRPRDSGVVLDDSDDDMNVRPSASRSYEADIFGMPRASTSVSTMGSDTDDVALVTPGFLPGANSGWPSMVNSGEESGRGRNCVDEFIIRTLAAGASKSTQGEPKRAPGTPVKKVKTAHLIGPDRPWQSAFAHKIGFPGFNETDTQVKSKKKGRPRKSMPAKLPALTVKGSHVKRSVDDVETEEEEEEVSPSVKRYEGLGIGRPMAGAPTALAGRTKWLMRRSSSGAFSSGSEMSNSASVTPTRLKGKDWQLPPPRLPGHLSPLHTATSRSTSGSSSSTVTIMNSPTVAATGRHAASNVQHRRGQSHGYGQSFDAATPYKPSTAFAHAHSDGAQFQNSVMKRLPIPSSEEQPGKFERDFVELDELGRGQFGWVMKARYKVASPHQDSAQEVFAIKKSKRFEGVKHRLRLREEVDILKHLSTVAGHPNVLAYIDSWEEDETLYIQTELCEHGNLAHFLWEYGRAFPRLDEARVWKIFADLSSGLRFMHDAGVIHLDIKPANIFVTGEGRFKFGDFGMASLWPRPPLEEGHSTGFEREGDKLYLAPEVLQGRYGKAADIFSLGMTMLETATNIVVPDQGEAWHRLRREDFSQVDLSGISPQLVDLLRSMMRTEPALRIDAGLVHAHPAVVRARGWMARRRDEVRRLGESVFDASPLGSVQEGFLDAILRRRGRVPMLVDESEWEDAMDIGL